MKTAIVTGASSGIGASVALRLLGDGYRVACVGRSRARMEAAVTPSPELCFVEADLASPEGCTAAISAALSALGSDRLDVLVNNAGAGKISQHLGVGFSVAAFDEVFAINVRTPFMLIHAAVDALVNARGVIVNMSSVAAVRPFAGMIPYCSAKAAVDMLTQGAALELAPRGVRCVGIAPGTIKTHFHENAGMSADTAEAYYCASAATHPIGRVGTADDIAAAVSFLVDPRSSFITGATLLIDGGRLLTSSTAPQLTSK